VGEWIFFMHHLRDDFMATMNHAERAAFAAHAASLRKRLAAGVLMAAGPCLGRINTGIAISEAPGRAGGRAGTPRRSPCMCLPLATGSPTTICCAAAPASSR